MSANVLNITGEIIAAIGGALVLTLFAVTFPILMKRPSVLPGSSGPRSSRGEQEEEKGGEVVLADGYVDSFAGLVSEAGGGLPPIVKISLLALVWWLIYLILNWSQGLLSIRTFQ